MQTPTHNLSFVKVGLEELENYLLSEVLYWPLSGSASLQRLTPGALLLGLVGLRVRCKSPEDREEMSKLEHRLELIRSKWRPAWEQKCKQEFRARLDLWKNYLADYQQSPGSYAGVYPQQVQWRVLMQLLALDSALLPGDVARLEQLDKMVESTWLPGAFIWDLDLTPGFPQPEYWFLYGNLKS
jgi:hypothetical protein